MTSIEEITQYLNKLQLKSAVMGYEKDGVLKTLQTLDGMYREAMEAERARQQTIIDYHAEQLAQGNRQLQSQSEENGALRGQLERLRQENEALREQLSRAEGSQTEYGRKQEALMNAMLGLQQDMEARKAQASRERDELLAQARRQAETLLDETERKTREQTEQANAKLAAIRQSREAAVGQLQRLKDQLEACLKGDEPFAGSGVCAAEDPFRVPGEGN